MEFENRNKLKVMQMIFKFGFIEGKIQAKMINAKNKTGTAFNNSDFKLIGLSYYVI